MTLIWLMFSNNKMADLQLLTLDQTSKNEEIFQLIDDFLHSEGFEPTSQTPSTSEEIPEDIHPIELISEDLTAILDIDFSNADIGTNNANFNTQENVDRPQVRNRMRTAFSSHQLIALEREFHQNQYLNRLRKIILAQSLNLSDRQIKIWFQYRRMKHKKIQEKTTVSSSHKNKTLSLSSRSNISCNTMASSISMNKSDDSFITVPQHQNIPQNVPNIIPSQYGQQWDKNTNHPKHSPIYPNKNVISSAPIENTSPQFPSNNHYVNNYQQFSNGYQPYFLQGKVESTNIPVRNIVEIEMHGNSLNQGNAI